MPSTKSYTLYYATNRHHIGDDYLHPSGYSSIFSDDGDENLRFGRLTVDADLQRVEQSLKAKVTGLGKGDGIGLAEYFASLVGSASINPYAENLKKDLTDQKQSLESFGSTGFFKDLKAKMMESTDVLVYIHGFNVTWEAAVGSALALQEMVKNYKELKQQVMVVLFTWPSEGKAIPYYSYLVDRADHVHSKVNQIDCTPVVPGGLFAVEHSYYMLGDITRDIVQTLADVPQDSTDRRRVVSTELPNTWKMK